MASNKPDIKAVVFDNAGVLIYAPRKEIFAAEVEWGLPAGTILQAYQSPGFAQRLAELERGSMSAETFERHHMRSYLEEHHPSVAARRAGTPYHKFLVTDDFLGESIRVEMLMAVRQLRLMGIKTAVLTNNWRLSDDNPGVHMGAATFRHRHEFDHVIESCVVGMSKPNEDLFHYTTELLGVKPQQIAFLDDYDWNVASGNRFGWKSILVGSYYVAAIRELETLIGCPKDQLTEPIDSVEADSHF